MFSHYVSSLTVSQYPPMGQCFRLKDEFDIAGFSPEVQVILQAIKTYGIILATVNPDFSRPGFRRWTYGPARRRK
jgi:hypothetical protein